MKMEENMIPENKSADVKPKETAVEEKLKKEKDPEFDKSCYEKILPKSKRKISWVNVFVLLVLLVFLGIVIYYFSTNESQMGNCEVKEDCGKYDVFYVTGEGYVCANKQMAEHSSIKSKIMMFKYARKVSVVDEPATCKCEENFCVTG